MLHLIPDDGQPHAPTTECGCDPQPATRGGRPVFVHFTPRAKCTWEFPDGTTWPPKPDTGDTDPPTWENQ